MNMKLSLVMPTYNDAHFIRAAIESVINQDYPLWELIVINDGSEDQTQQVVSTFSDTRIKYFYQDNQGQLNALINASRHISGDIVILFHSDDLLAHTKVLSEINHRFEFDKDIDGLYGDYILIDREGKEKKRQQVMPYNNENIIKSLLFKRGSNPVGDTFIVKKEIFNHYVLPHYLIDNTSYFVDFKHARAFRLKKIEPWYQYRIFEENYIRSDLGKFVTINGCLRTTYKLFCSPCFFGSSLIYNSIIYNLISKFNVWYYLPLKRHSPPNWSEFITYYTLWKKKLERDRYPEILIKQIEKIIHSLKMRKKNLKQFPLIVKDTSGRLYQGKDATFFYNDYLSSHLSPLYQDILFNNFDHIIVYTEEDKRAVENAIRFYSLFYEVVIKDSSEHRL